MSNESLGGRRDFRSLFDELDGVALWTVSEPEKFEYVSAGFEDIWGMPPDEIEDDIGKLIETIHPDDRERVRSNIGASTELRDTEYEGRVVRPDCSIRWTLNRQVILRDKAGNVSEIVGVSTDITDQK